MNFLQSLQDKRNNFFRNYFINPFKSRVRAHARYARSNQTKDWFVTPAWCSDTTVRQRRQTIYVKHRNISVVVVEMGSERIQRR